MGTGAPTSFSARPVPPWQVEGDWSNQVQERAPSLGSQPVLLPPRPSPPHGASVGEGRVDWLRALRTIMAEISLQGGVCARWEQV